MTFQLLLFIKYLATSDFFTQNILFQVIKALCLDVIWGISQFFYFLLPGWQKNDHVIFFYFIKEYIFWKKNFQESFIIWITTFWNNLCYCRILFLKPTQYKVFILGSLLFNHHKTSLFLVSVVLIFLLYDDSFNNPLKKNILLYNTLCVAILKSSVIFEITSNTWN